MSQKRLQKSHSKVPQKSFSDVALPRTVWPLLASAGVLFYGVYRAILFRWICDEPFITFRYIKNFFDGNGLVYNVGERVEGYTHFLWLMLLVAGRAIGFDLVDTSIWLGIVSYTGILILLLAASYRNYKKSPRGIWLPLSAALFAVNYNTTVWASGGLETSLYAFLILLAFYLWFYSGFSEQRRLILTGTILAFVPLTRPDGVLFTVTAVALLTIRGVKHKQSVSSLTWSIFILLLPSIIVGLPYLAWKYYYYGNLLPNTYYAKSGDENYYGQGIFYIWLYLCVHFTSAVALAAGAWFLLSYRNKGEQLRKEGSTGSPVITAFICSVVYLVLFVIRSGGDFMFARFIIPVAGFIYIVTEGVFDRLTTKSKRQYRILIALLLALLVFAENKLRYGVLFHLKEDGTPTENWNLPDTPGQGSTRGIADERWAYYSDHFMQDGMGTGVLEGYSEVGKYLEPHFRGLPVTVAIPGAMNMIAYYGNFKTCINEYGLTDAYIAHLQVAEHARIGHEKKAPEQYLIARNVDFELRQVVSEIPEHLGPTTIAFQIPDHGLWQLARVVTYNKTVMNELYKRFKAADNQSRIPLFEYIISDYALHTVPNRPLDLLEKDYAGFRKFYFDRYPDTTLQHYFETRIEQLKQDSIAGKPVN